MIGEEIAGERNGNRRCLTFFQMLKKIESGCIVAVHGTDGAGGPLAFDVRPGEFLPHGDSTQQGAGLLRGDAAKCLQPVGKGDIVIIENDDIFAVRHCKACI